MNCPNSIKPYIPKNKRYIKVLSLTENIGNSKNRQPNVKARTLRPME